MDLRGREATQVRHGAAPRLQARGARSLALYFFPPANCLCLLAGAGEVLAGATAAWARYPLPRNSFCIYMNLAHNLLTSETNEQNFMLTVRSLAPTRDGVGAIASGSGSVAGCGTASGEHSAVGAGLGSRSATNALEKRSK